MSKKVIITAIPLRQRLCRITAVKEDGIVTQIQLAGRERENLLGNIYIGKVEKIQENIRAAFVRIAPGLTCYYPMPEHPGNGVLNRRCDGRLLPGDEIMVQVEKEALKEKLPGVTTNLSFTGKYLVLTSGRKDLGLSGKLDNESKRVLRMWIEPLMEEDFGAIVRTNAKFAGKQELLGEFDYLKQRLRRVMETGRSRTCYSLLERTPEDYIQLLRDTAGEELTEIVTDDEEVYQTAASYLEQFQPGDRQKLTFYEDALLPLVKLHSLERALSEALREKVWLKSGGFLVIQQTEAFVVIDVNSGKYTGKKKAQETYRRINLEAAAEIARQMLLRQLSGIILIDFINMQSEDHKQELLHVLQKYCRKDPVKTVVVDMTALNIVEVTRQKVKKSLAEQAAELDWKGETGWKNSGDGN